MDTKKTKRLEKLIRKTLSVLLVLQLLLFSLPQIIPEINQKVEAADAWYNSSWVYRQKITIQSSQVPSQQSGFPVYIDLSDLSRGSLQRSAPFGYYELPDDLDKLSDYEETLKKLLNQEPKNG